jgi:DMSO/TMAO reductase YedYZ heme-binding membrane subunit
MDTHLWWYVARAGGLLTWALAAASVLWGLALSTRALGRKPGAPWLLDLHRYLGGLTVVFAAIHLLGLWADSFVTFGWRELLVPFASTWRPGAVAWGIVAFYLLLAVELTSLLKKHVPKRWWKGVHVSSYALFVFGTVHLFTAGTDHTNPLVWWSVIATLAAVVFFTVYRIIGPGRAASVRPIPTQRHQVNA